MARSVEELEAWAELLKLCIDDCKVFSTTPAMRHAVVEVEMELTRLHKMEDCAIRLARLFKMMRDNYSGIGEEDQEKEDRWEEAMQNLWNKEGAICATIERLLPEAFTPQAMADETATTE